MLSFAAFLAATVAGAASGGGIATDGANVPATVDTGSAIVQLNGAPLSTYAKTKPPQGKKIDFSSNAVKSYRAQLSALRNDFKQWLQANAPAAQVVGQYDISLNAVAVRLNGVSLGTIASAPQVQQAQYEGLYHPLASDPDLPLINTYAAWSANGASPANAGDGVKVGIIDTGIDITHPCFSDAGYPAVQQLGDKQYTNNKVIVAKVFNNKLNQNGFDAGAVQEHGTHVAGTVACDANTPAIVDGISTYAMSGVAPRALLGSYNVFPGNVTNARSEDILNALDAAYQDGMDVVNMSLGGNAHGVQDLLTTAIDDFDAADMVVAVAAGNSGPGHYTVESPGSAARALTAGASTVPHFMGVTATGTGGPYQLAVGDFGKASAPLSGSLSLGGPALSRGCSAFAANAFAGTIAVISRGACTFSTKIRNAQAAGAIATIVVNNVNGDPIAMGEDGTANQPTIPAYMVGIAKASAIVAAAQTAGNSVTIGATESYIQTTNANYMAGFSSQGPTDVDFRVKPDVVAPGVNVLSSIPHQFCGAPPCFAFFQGTSMATPHLAGSAALVLWQHPGWSAADVRSAIVNTASSGLQPYRNPVNGVPRVDDVNIIGAGLDNVGNAVNASVTLDPVSTSLGSVPSGSGQTRTATIAVTNRGSGPISVAVVPGYHTGSTYGVTFAATYANGVVTVTMDASKSAALGDHEATLLVNSGGSTVAHSVLYTFVK